MREAIEHYFQGHATGVGDHFRKAFHPDAKLFFIRDGKFSTWTLDEYVSRASGKPAPDEAERKRSIANIDISGNAADSQGLARLPQRAVCQITCLCSRSMVSGRSSTRRFTRSRRNARSD